MAERRPIVLLDDGRKGELPPGDTLPDVGSSGASFLPVCLTDQITIFNVPLIGGNIGICLTDGSTIFNVPVV